MQLRFENLEPEYITLALLGMIIYVLKSIVNRKDTAQKVSVGSFFKNGKNWARILLAIVSTMAVLLMADDIAKILGITVDSDAPAKSVCAFLAGFFNYNIIDSLLKKFGKKINADSSDQSSGNG